MQYGQVERWGCNIEVGDNTARVPRAVEVHEPIVALQRGIPVLCEAVGAGQKELGGVAGGRVRRVHGHSAALLAIAKDAAIQKQCS